MVDAVWKHIHLHNIQGRSNLTKYTWCTNLWWKLQIISIVTWQRLYKLGTRQRWGTRRISCWRFISIMTSSKFSNYSLTSKFVCGCLTFYLNILLCKREIWSTWLMNCNTWIISKVSVNHSDLISHWGRCSRFGSKRGLIRVGRLNGSIIKTLLILKLRLSSMIIVVCFSSPRLMPIQVMSSRSIFITQQSKW